MVVSVTAAVLGVRHVMRWAHRHCENAMVGADETLTIEERIEWLVDLRDAETVLPRRGGHPRAPGPAAERRERARGG
jgi:hypothetical protein